jgi:hypothetical protein
LRKIAIAMLAKLESKLELIIMPRILMTIRRPLEILHMDLFGLVAYISIGGNKYGPVIVDDYSRFTWVFFYKIKVKTQEVLNFF